MKKKKVMETKKKFNNVLKTEIFHLLWIHKAAFT